MVYQKAYQKEEWYVLPKNQLSPQEIKDVKAHIHIIHQRGIKIPIGVDDNNDIVSGYECLLEGLIEITVHYISEEKEEMIWFPIPIYIRLFKEKQPYPEDLKVDYEGVVEELQCDIVDAQNIKVFVKVQFQGTMADERFQNQKGE